MAERPKEKNNENEKKETDSKDDAVKPDHGEEKISRVSHGAMMTPSDLPGCIDGVNGKKDPGKKVVSSSVKEPTDTKNAGNETEMVQPGKDKIGNIVVLIVITNYHIVLVITPRDPQKYTLAVVNVEITVCT